ncbi:MAG TPA: hypothetical protein VHV55_18335 [Pirellulales bacterium]|nr:hypothetical protein [Pirellulales bacterium]
MFRFNFHGGFLDGLSLVSGRNHEGLPLPGQRYVFLTDRGRVGARFREASPERDAEMKRLIDESPQPIDLEQLKEFAARLERLGSQIYEVTRRDERPDEIVVHVNFVGEESAGTTVGGATDDPYVDLIAELRFPTGRPHAGDVATCDALLAEMLQYCSSPIHGGCSSPTYGVGDGPGELHIITRWADEATGRQRIVDVLGRVLPGIEFTITAIHGPTPSP